MLSVVCLLQVLFCFVKQKTACEVRISDWSSDVCSSDLTRLTVIDRVPAADPNAFPVSPGVAPDTATLLTWVLDLVPPRAPSPEAPPPVTPIAIQPMTAKSARHRVAPVLAPVPAVAPDALELAYEAIDWTPAEAAGLTDAIYEPYA